MVEKIKGYPARNWEGILAGLISTAIWAWGQSVFASFGEFAKALANMSTIYSVLLWTVFSIGVGFTIYSFIRVIQRILKGNKNSDYEDITVEYYEYPWTNIQRNLGVGNIQNFLKIGLLVTNTGNYKINCALRMMDSKYKGYASNNDLVPDPTPAEKKLFKWDEGYETKNGRIDIAPHTGVGKILFAESNPHDMQFWYWLVDGKSQERLLEGIYKVLIQVEIDFEKDGKMISIRPQNYEVDFSYRQRKLFDVSVRKA